MFLNPDLHLHSIFSDGSDNTTTLLENVKLAGVDLFSLTDHDCYDGCFEIEKMLTPGDPKFIKGIELSCKDDFGKYHILGYCFNTNKDSIKKAVDITHKSRRDKSTNRLDFLKREYGFEFKEEDIVELLNNTNPGKPHFVELLLKYDYVKNKEEGFKLIAGYHGPERKLSPEEAIGAIMQADGIPVLAHGINGEGKENLSEEEITNRVSRLKGFGLMGLECFYSTYTNNQKGIMLDLANKYNLLVTAGSDYHGTRKTIRIGETNNPTYDYMKRFYRTIEMLLD